MMNVSEEAVIVPTARLMRTDMTEEAIKVVTVAALWTAPLTSMVLQRQLLTRSQTLTMVVVAVTFLVAFARQVVCVANFLSICPVQKAIESCSVRTWKLPIDALLIGIERYELWSGLFFGCDIDNRSVAALLTDRGPGIVCGRGTWCGSDRHGFGRRRSHDLCLRRLRLRLRLRNSRWWRHSGCSSLLHRRIRVGPAWQILRSKDVGNLKHSEWQLLEAFLSWICLQDTDT